MIEIRYTKHAVEKMQELGITVNEVKQAMIKGLKFGPNSRGCMHTRLNLIEVVYDRRNNVCSIVTVYWVRR